MVFSKADEEPENEAPETELSETRYMGEGPPGRKGGGTEMSETEYMGEPEEESKTRKHEFEYKRKGPQIGKATRPPLEKKDKKRPA